MIRVFLVDDHAILREGLRRLIDEQPDLAVAGEAGTAAEALRRAASETWDVVLLDLNLPDMSGLHLLRKLLELRPRLRVLCLSMHAEDAYALRILRAGAAGYLTKARPADMLLSAIRKIAGGGRYVTEELADRLLVNPQEGAGPPHELLSPRQLDVLLLVGRGRSPSEIAQVLGLRASTVSTHLQQIKQRLGLRTNGELAQYALKEGLI